MVESEPVWACFALRHERWLRNLYSFAPIPDITFYFRAPREVAVNRALAQIYGSGAIVDVFRRTFGPNAKPTPALVLVFALGTYPE